ncbi:MAG: FKBP-type peptidyl-prolyl cis-trans isomerase [Candidatus Hodarchaeales archaeon]|jgi:FKBP-type peptidyl-prolyl cis-trans isomerase 2
MTISENDWIKIEYTGRLKENSKIFDTTLEDVARKEQIFDEKRGYTPLLCRAGDEKFLIPGLAKQLVGLELDTTHTIEVPVKDAYGERDTSKIEMVPTKRLRKANLDPRVGNRVQLAGKSGTIIWAGGGRTRIDYNHPLAGKDLVFEITIKEHISDEDQILKEIISRRLPGVNLEEASIETLEDPKTIIISLPNYLMFMEGLAIAKYTLGTDLNEFLGYEVVKIQDVFDYQKKEEIPEDAPEKTDEKEEE